MMTMVFGGAFDPVHFGHIKPLLELANHLEAAQIRLLPCYQHPNKVLIASPEHRFKMLQLVVHLPQWVVDTHDLERQDICYTVDTLTDLRDELGAECSLCFVLGQDAFTQIVTWKHYERILDIVNLIVLTRRGFGSDEKHPLLQRCGGWSPLVEASKNASGKLCRFYNHPVTVSSSDVRECLSLGEQPKYLLPGVVWNYIRRHRLYAAMN